MLLNPGLKIIMGVLNSSLVLVTPSSEGGNDEFTDVRRNLLMVFGGLNHFRTNTFIRLRTHTISK
jgi:hypothetical protein